MRFFLDRSSAVFSALSALFAVTATHAQEIHTSIEPPHSIIHLASAPRPQGQLLARNLNDATFEHVPSNYHVFTAATAGEDAGVETLTLTFDAGTRLTAIESKDKDFIVESGGSCHEGNLYSKGDSCFLMVRFNPQGPGHRFGSLSISHTAEPTPMFVGLTGNGYAPAVSFTPSQITTVPVTVSGSTGTVKSSVNLTVDGGDVLYIPDIGNNIIKEIDSSGAINTVSPAFATPSTIAADSSGFLYSMNTSGSTYYFSFYAPWGSQTAYGTAHSAGTCTPSTPCALTSVGMSQPANVSIDPYDNLFFEEETKGAAEMPVASLAGGSGSLNLWYLTNQFVYSSGSPAPFAVDPSDNIYNFYNYGTGTCYIQAEPLYNAEYSPVAKKVAGGSACGFSGDGGQARGAEISNKLGQITFDNAGNLYFADAGNQRIRRIDAATGIIQTIAGSGVAGYYGDGGAATTAAIASPSGLAVDSQGQVYILSNAPVAGPTQVVRKIGTLGYWNYGNQLKATASATKVFSVSNTGNSDLTLSSNALLNGPNVSDFAIDTTVTNCVLTANATLAPGHTCYIGIKFTPLATGTRTANLTLLDNTATGSNTIRLVGIGVLPSPTMKITSPTASSSVKAGTAVTFSVSVTGAPQPTGTVTFKVNGSNVGSVVTVSSTGVATTTFTESSAASYTLSATYSGDTNYSTVTVSEALTVTAAVKAASTVNLVRSAARTTPDSLSCGSQAFTVQVLSASGGIPTGTVQLKSGTSVLASSTLSNGKATLSPGNLTAGSHALTASYGGDSLHQPATSASLTVLPGASLGFCPIQRFPVSRTAVDF